MLIPCRCCSTSHYDNLDDGSSVMNGTSFHSANDTSASPMYFGVSGFENRTTCYPTWSM